jgi:hypothetical protein
VWRIGSSPRSPASCQSETSGPDRDVEAPARLAREIDGARQQLRDLRGDDERARTRGAVQPRDVAVGAPGREQPLEALHLGERIVARAPERGLVAPDERQLEHGAHRITPGRDFSLRGRGAARTTDRGEQSADRRSEPQGMSSRSESSPA